MTGSVKNVHVRIFYTNSCKILKDASIFNCYVDRSFFYITKKRLKNYESLVLNMGKNLHANMEGFCRASPQLLCLRKVCMLWSLMMVILLESYILTL